MQLYLYTLLSWLEATQRKKVPENPVPQTRLCRVTSLRTPWGMRKPRQGSERLPARSAPGVCCWHSLPGQIMQQITGWWAPVSCAIHHSLGENISRLQRAFNVLSCPSQRSKSLPEMREEGTCRDSWSKATNQDLVKLWASSSRSCQGSSKYLFRG